MLATLLEMFGLVGGVAMLTLFAFAEVIVSVQDRGRSDSAASLAQRTTDVVRGFRAAHALETVPEPHTQAQHAGSTRSAAREGRLAVACTPARGMFRTGRVAS